MPDTAWFVPAIKDERRYPVDGQLVVARTRDGGDSFEVLRAGLPQQHAYDLVYRHARSTTGGVWTTADQGDRWQQLPARLPPIHALAFAG